MYFTTGIVTPVSLAPTGVGSSIGVGDTPSGIAIAPNGYTAYVDNGGYNGVVTPVNLATNTAESSIPLSTNSQPNTIVITPDQAPTASFGDTPGTVGSATTFDASASSAPVGAITTYAWNFGDGTGATTSTPAIVHTYVTPGLFTATLTVTDSAEVPMARVILPAL